MACVALGLVAVATLAAALLHGPALAGLGVVGAFVTPMLVASDKPDFWSLYIYIAIVTAAACGLARSRMWGWLAGTTIVFGKLWTRDGLSKRDRSLVTLGMLIALRAGDELTSHFQIGRNNGLTDDELAEVIYHATGYGGCPAANAAPALGSAPV